MIIIKKLLTLISVYTLSIFFVFSSVANTNFPVTGKMRIQVDFWKKVYTEITTQEAFVHDSKDLTIIYSKVSLPSSRRAKHRQGKKNKQIIRNILKSIAKKNYQNLTIEENKIAKIIGQRSKKELFEMAKNVRHQYGLKDRYYNGLKRSYAYLDYIKEAFKKRNLPKELIFLPHVESSFNYRAYSKVGAAGIWQFMRGTARNYGLKVGYIVDERRDPLKATHAAARLLKDNYRILGKWPLALTAYNHGARSIQRAVKRVNSTDINTIIEKYDGRRFGFASKNFYATFMATVEISEDPGKYFPKFKKPAKHIFSTIKLNRPYTIKQVIKTLNIDKKIIREFNPSVRYIAYKSTLYLPKGFTLNIPKTTNSKISEHHANLLKIKQPINKMEFEQLHIVSRGENLFDISKIYKTSMTNIIHFNQISNPSRIFPGMKLKIPGKNSKKKAVTTKPKIAKIKKQEKVSQPKPPTLKRPSPTNIPSALVTLESYNLDLKPVSKNIYKLTVETEETLGHYAEWANIKTQEIRNLNRFSFSSTIHLNQHINIKITEIALNKFKKKRNEYHISNQEDFYQSFKVTGIDHYKVKRGDNLSQILKKLSLPYWLVRKQQTAKKLSDKLFVNQKILIPIVESTEVL